MLRGRHPAVPPVRGFPPILRALTLVRVAFTILAVIGGRAPAAQAGAADRVRAAMPIDWDLTGGSPPTGLA
jgi:hypothetical protein